MDLSTDEIRSRLKEHSLFSTLLKTEIDLIIEHAQLLEYETGTRVVTEGDAGDGVFLILEGELKVSKSFAGVHKTLNRLRPGQGFGEISLISDAPRTATVTTTSAVICLKLNNQTFEQLLSHNSHFALRITRILSQRLLSSERAGDQQLIESYQALIFALSDLAESRDPETGTHLLRVQNYCRELAKLMAQSEQYRDHISAQFIDDIYVSSPLHDIGKVGIPDDILLKPGKLTEAEFEIMKSHATLGAKTLDKVLSVLESSTFRVAQQVILHHHERHDGSGYPAGLKGDEISLAGRIMALADVYDALLSKRVNKEAFDYPTTTGIIKEGRGSHFDPDITDLFLANIERFEAIHQQFAEDSP